MFTIICFLVLQNLCPRKKQRLLVSSFHWPDQNKVRRDYYVMRRKFSEEEKDFVAIETGAKIERDSVLLDNNYQSCKDNSSSARTRSFYTDGGTKYTCKKTAGNSAIEIALAKQNLLTLREALQKHCTHVFKFTEYDATSVINSVFIASKNDYRLIAGSADFVSLLLSMEEYNSNQNEGDQINSKDDFFVMTRDTLVASAFHYCDCILARDAGIYDVINGIMRNPSSLQTALLPSSRSNLKIKSNENKDIVSSGRDGRQSISLEVVGKNSFIDLEVEGKNAFINVAKAISSKEGNQSLMTKEMVFESNLDIFDIDSYGDEAMRISNSLAQIKKAEIMTHALVPQIASSVYPSPAEAASLRGLLLSLSDDWRALAIRTTASLYRLRATLDERYSSQQFSGLYSKSSNDKSTTSAQTIREAREALYVYAPLAQRLGMNRLKSELEDTAFRVLYRRQYMITQSLYDKSGSSIQSVMSFLKTHIEILLKNDEWLSSRVERISVSARIKEPYSLWKKLIRQRFDILDSQKSSSGSLLHGTNKFSLLNVKDTIAFRIVLRGKRYDSADSTLSEKSFDESLCYYVEKLLLHKWSTVDCRRKDYIAKPKPNGYQSLHHTASIFRYGENWPFEVQIRSEGMHIDAEFGDASHWTYKGHRDVNAIVSKNSVDKGHRDVNAIVSKNAVGNDDLVGLPQASPLALPQHAIPLFDADDKAKNEKTIKGLYIDALASARDDLLDNSAFIFFSSSNNAFDGKVISVPVGSNVRDALCVICESFDVQTDDSYTLEASDLRINGKIVELDEKINNGDMLTVN